MLTCSGSSCLALLLCPDPYAHREVWNHCLVPLLEERVIMDAEHYMRILRPEFQLPWPHNWIP